MGALPETMRQIMFDSAGGPEVIRVTEAALPQIAPGKLLVEVAAAGINRPDCIQREGKYPPPPGETAIPGLEVAGHIVAMSDDVGSFKLGDAICALVGSGGYAEYALVDAPLAFRVPQGMSLTEAAALPETFFTVYDNVFTRGRLKAGESFLVHGGSSGIGSTAIQLAKQAGATVFATAGSPDKCAFCKTLGADHAIDYRAQDFVEEIKKATDKRGVDVVLDMVGGSYVPKNISILATDGRLVQIAFLKSSKIDALDFMPVMIRRLTLTGSTMRARPLAMKAEVAAALREKVWPLLDQGLVKPAIHATFPLEDARQAHELMESSTHLGKIVLLTGKG